MAQKESCAAPNISMSSMVSGDVKIGADRASDKQGISGVANADSGSSGVYIATRDISCLSNVESCNNFNKINVTVANGQSIASSHIGQLRVPSGHTITAYIFPNINGSLLSVSSFVDLGYIVSYSEKKVDFF
jgi:hypothetical protein